MWNIKRMLATYNPQYHDNGNILIEQLIPNGLGGHACHHFITYATGAQCTVNKPNFDHNYSKQSTLHKQTTG